MTDIEGRQHWIGVRLWAKTVRACLSNSSRQSTGYALFDDCKMLG
jgi:hypothetical protein